MVCLEGLHSAMQQLKHRAKTFGAAQHAQGGVQLAGIAPGGMLKTQRRAIAQHQGIQVRFDIDADATPEEIEAVVAQSQKRSAVYDILTNPSVVQVEVRA